MNNRYNSWRPRQRAFTLFEIAIALGLIGLAVVSVLTLFPAGLAAQRLARFRMVAAVKAEEMVECFATVAAVDTGADAESPWPWDVPACRRPHDHDLETRLASHRHGIMPLPPAIARRLDSDRDEIAAHLDAGGSLYYAHPYAATSTEETTREAAPGNETQTLVFAVVGAAQQNATAWLTAKAWPYYAPWPSPPLHGLHSWDSSMRTAPDANDGRFGWREPWWFHAYAWEVANDPHGDMKAVFNGTGSDAAGEGPFGFLNYGYGHPWNDPAAATQATAVRYLQAALWYCVSRGTTPEFYAPSDPNAAAQRTWEGDPPDDQRWEQVGAMRFLAHAAACMTRWHTRTELDAGIDIPAAAITDPRTGAPADDPSPAITLSHDLIVSYHERSLALAAAYAAHLPYDWGSPRPAQRAIMMDQPLVQLDLFSPPTVGAHADGGEPAEQWRPLTAQPVTNLGVSREYPAVALPTQAWGDPAHFSLCAPFAADERCREIVFWSVDWRAYEDCETAPGATVDAAKYPLCAPADAAPSYQPTAAGSPSRMNCAPFLDHRLFSYRHPEKVLMFRAPVAGLDTGADVTALIVGNADYDRNPDQGPHWAPPSPEHIRCFSARFGADRDFDGRLDRGPVPVAARMRALAVARFVFYDPRVPVVLR